MHDARVDEDPLRPRCGTLGPLETNLQRAVPCHPGLAEGDEHRMDDHASGAQYRVAALHGADVALGLEHHGSSLISRQCDVDSPVDVVHDMGCRWDDQVEEVGALPSRHLWP